MPNSFITKLALGVHLTEDDRVLLREICTNSYKVGAREDVVQQGDRPKAVHLVIRGFACRYKMLPSGDRQIVAILLPGDFCDLHVTILGQMDHAIGTLTDCTIVEISCDTVEELTTQHPRITRALWRSTLVDESTLREWLVNMGQRPADRQMAHFFCELLTRLQVIGAVSGDSYEMPLTQEELGDTLGLSTVHVNRVLQQLRADGLISLKGKTLTIPDVDRLKAFAQFDPSYLHLTQRWDGHENQAREDGARHT